jgi:DNA replication protein DnaD
MEWSRKTPLYAAMYLISDIYYFSVPQQVKQPTKLPKDYLVMYLTFKRELVAHELVLAILERDSFVYEQALKENKAYFLAPVLRINQLRLTAEGLLESIKNTNDCITRLYEKRLMRKEQRELNERIVILQPQADAVHSKLTRLLKEAEEFECKRNRSHHNEQPISLQNSTTKSFTSSERS